MSSEIPSFTPSPNVLHKPSESGADKDKDKESKKSSSTTKSKAIGSLAFEHPPASTDKAESSNPFSKLFGRPEAVDKQPSTKDPAAEHLGNANHESAKDINQPEMSADDELYSAQQIAEIRAAELAAETPPADAASQAAHEDAQAFYANILEHDMLPAPAANEILDRPSVVDGKAESKEPAAAAETADDDPSNSTIPPAAAAGGGSTPPPRGPGTPGGPTSPNTPPNPDNNPNQSPVPPTALYGSGAPNVVAVPVVTRTEYVPYIDRSRAFGDALVGGIVGYLIGRRRGRIKTERKLLPVQEKLKKEVKTLSQSIAEKEFAIREAAKRRVREQQLPAAAVKRPEVSPPLRNQKASAETVVLDRRQPPVSAPEIHKPRTAAPPPERIGKVLIAAEAAAVSKAPGRPELISALPQERPSSPDKRSTEKQVETLSRNELLMLSEKVIVEGSTLRQVYETHLITERGLRRLIVEYLRGGDIVKAFKRELVEREIDFERDPKLRDTIRQSVRGGGASPTLQKLLQQAGVAPGDDSQQTVAEARAQQLQQAKQQARQHNRRKYVDVSLMTIIAVLMAIIIILAVNKF